MASIVVGVVALIAGILPLTAPFGAALAVLALSLSLIGLYKARGGAKGKGAAITGFIIGLVSLSAACLWFAIAITTLWRVEPVPDLAREARAEIDRTGPTTAIDALQIGGCFQDPVGGAEVDAVPIVACAQPHDNEVYAILIVQEGPGAPYPGPLQMRATADGECQADPFEAYIGQSYLLSSLEAVAYYPSQARWAAGDREILCVVSDPVGQVSGSLRGTGEPVIQPRPIRPVPRPSVTPLPLPPPPPG
ncbi:MAG: septum formation family protein [Egibacteraceae bacterium]